MVPHFWTPKVRVTGMKYPWPLPDPDPVLDEALDIAFGYLEATGQAKNGDDMQHFVAGAVLGAWLRGTRQKIRLANVGIVLVERARASPKRNDLRLDVLRDLAIP
jgi:hypothetical protein